MRAIVLLCLLQVFGGDAEYSWNGPSPTTQQTVPDMSDMCLVDQASCGCCLIQKQMNRMEQFFNLSSEAMHQEMKKSKATLDNLRASRSAFSVALNNHNTVSCYGPFAEEKLVVYNHVFLNLGGGYNLQSGVFTVPRSGVYSLTVTIYATNEPSCAQLEVNGSAAAQLLEGNGQDDEDSSTVVVALKLKAGDNVTVSLPQGCLVCDDRSHFNTFTGFLLYATG